MRRAHCPRCRPTGRQLRQFSDLVGEDSPLRRDAFYDKLKANGIHGRRYFYPLFADFPMDCGLPFAQASDLPVASDAAARVICLPIDPDLDDVNLGWIIDCLSN